MAEKLKTIYICSECGFESPKWNGKCPECGEWNSFVEEVRSTAKTGAKAVPVHDVAQSFRLDAIDTQAEQRYLTGLSELDRVLGGGIVRGSLVLLGGEPGIGKSTMLLQICEKLGQHYRILYISGEESLRQIKLRANRLGVKSSNLSLATQTDIETVVNTIAAEKPDIVMVDSIQTMSLRGITSSPGSVSQVRECTNLLMRTAKSEEIPIFIVGHVNKDGAIAGPKVLEHIVDAVLYFEGDRQFSYRILRTVKNRYGSTGEIGVFEMSGKGLYEVDNPSMMLLEGRPTGVSGTCVSCIMEGSRPIFAEVQALVTRTGFGTPRRTATGFDYNRMSLLLAVLEKRGGYHFSSLDAYINVVGGLRLDEPAADLAVCLSLISSLTDKTVDDDLIAFGEVGLSGEIRTVQQAEKRILEAKKLGFRSCVLPQYALKGMEHPERLGIDLLPVSSIEQVITLLK